MVRLSLKVVVELFRIRGRSFRDYLKRMRMEDGVDTRGAVNDGGYKVTCRHRNVAIHSLAHREARKSMGDFVYTDTIASTYANNSYGK